MSPRKPRRWINACAGLVALLVTLVIFERTHLDFRVQDHLFDFERQQWLIDEHEPRMRVLFYSGPKILLIAFGVFSIAAVFFPGRWRSRLGIDAARRRGLLVVFLSLALTPSLVGWLKATTNVFCPAQLSRYGGAQSYRPVFERYSDEQRPVKRGRCFPAGHASGGFALFALVSLARSRRECAMAYAIAIFFGGAMGIYQMAKGAHFLSHTLVTAILAWLIAWAIEGVLPHRSMKGASV